MTTKNLNKKYRAKKASYSLIQDTLREKLTVNTTRTQGKGSGLAINKRISKADKASIKVKY